jgi:uncharacterized coiled-coil DUF342 family protein
MLVQVTGTKLVRDTETMALINKDINGLEEYNLKRRMMANQKTEINNIKSEIKGIKSELGELKSMISQLLDKLNG